VEDDVRASAKAMSQAEVQQVAMQPLNNLRPEGEVEDDDDND
jgi:hypothetical protein